ncbi:MAG: spore maturation protein [Bacteroidales bacterium]|nr:spore maturation protein [Bacteroidales bacterium]
MLLNYIWVFFIIVGFVFSLIQLVFFHNSNIFNLILTNIFEMAKLGFDISIGLTGLLCLWMGLMKIAEKNGVITYLAKIISPLFSKLFPEIPKNHPVSGSIVMNIAANMLGLDNAATPIGLKAMQQLQELNPTKEKASNAQIMFIVLNASGLTIIPMSIMLYRFQLGAQNPSDVFIPIFLATTCSTLAGLISVAIVQKINIFNKILLFFLSSLFLLIGIFIFLFTKLPSEKIQTYSTIFANFIILTLITLIVMIAIIKKINVYETFIDGAKEGFNIAIKIIPYLVAILVAVGIFRTSGAMDVFIKFMKYFFEIIGLNTSFVDALPTAIMKPLSGSGARGLMIETMKTFGPDSFAGRLSCIFQGATDTTFYIISVYFGSVGIKNIRHALGCSLIADFFGILAAIVVAYMFFA